MRHLKYAQPEAQPGRLFVVPPRPLTPPLKWAGGKRWQLPHLRIYWEANRNRRLVEPFCGGLAVALGLQPEKALLNDVNPHLINFYTHLQTGLERKLRLRNDTKYYYAARTRFNSLIHHPDSNPQQRAELFYYLNRTGFNGLCRFNRRGEFNVPFGSYKVINYAFDFMRYKEAFKNWRFLSHSYRDLDIKRDDFIYADPPYDVEFTSYSSGGFTWKQQIDTAEWLSEHTGPVILSNQATHRILKLYSELGFSLHLYDAPRRISCTGDRRPAKEVLATRNL